MDLRHAVLGASRGLFSFFRSKVDPYQKFHQAVGPLRQQLEVCSNLLKVFRTGLSSHSCFFPRLSDLNPQLSPTV